MAEGIVDLEVQALAALEESLGRDISELAAAGGGGDQREARLTADIRSGMSKMRGHHRALEALAEEQETDAARDGVMELLAARLAAYESAKVDLRKANIAAKARENKTLLEQRAALFGDTSTDDKVGKRAQGVRDEQGVVGEAEDITATLRRTRQRMVQEAERGQETLAALDSSNSTLSSADQELKSQHPLLRSAKELLRTLQTQEVLERVLLWAGFGIFLIVVCFIAYKRVLRGAAPPARDCTWGDWGEWGECSASCGEEGEVLRTRVKAVVEAGGGGCAGTAAEVATCVGTSNCPPPSHLAGGRRAARDEL